MYTVGVGSSLSRHATALVFAVWHSGMTRLVHLSDLHIDPARLRQARIVDSLVETLRREHADAKDDQDDQATVVITGDVFDSAGSGHVLAPIRHFLGILQRLLDAVGADANAIVLPGNHDRRRNGLLGPHRTELFSALRQESDPSRIFVAGCRTPFLAEIVPEPLHRLPAHVLAYDSTYLPSGYIGAGGTIRVEDILRVAASLPQDGRPLLFLVHHHLIPTPLTDTSRIDAAGTSRITRWALRHVLPALISHGDREELTMTALGAGTALSTLQTLGRAVLLLHGHKHVPTARMLAGINHGCADLLLASAGSAGTRERVQASRHPDAARLWPSFNKIELSDERVRIESISFAPRHHDRPPLRRELVHARRFGARWIPEPVSSRVKHSIARVERDEATYTLLPATGNEQRWDFECERYVSLHPGATLRRYVDFVHAHPHAHAHANESASREPRSLLLELDGCTRHRVHAGLSRTLEDAARSRGPGTAFEWVGLLCRYGASRATLRLERLGVEGLEPFASITDLALGRERPLSLQDDEDGWFAVAENCAPRSLLRIYWALPSTNDPRR